MKIVLQTQLELQNEKSSISNCEVNPFPTFSYGNDGELYWNIFKFLDSGTDDGKRKWPDYILNIKDKRLRDLKKLISIEMSE